MPLARRARLRPPKGGRRARVTSAKHSDRRRRREDAPETLPTMAIRADLDAIDWKILRELQDDGRMTNVELSRRVGISAPPCLRRVKRLEDAGIIRGYRAMLNSPALGMDVVALCLVGLRHQSDAELKAFSELARGWRIVREAWVVYGDFEFML